MSTYALIGLGLLIGTAAGVLLAQAVRSLALVEASVALNAERIRVHELEADLARAQALAESRLARLQAAGVAPGADEMRLH